MSSRAGRPNRRTEDFTDKWDRISRSTRVDPLRLLFRIAGGKKMRGCEWDESDRLKALTTLMQYRYPKLRSIEAKLADDDRELVFRWMTDGDSDPV